MNVRAPQGKETTMFVKTWGRRLAFLLSICLVTLLAWARTAQRNPKPVPAPDPCAKRVEDASRSGWVEGFVAGSNAPVDSFSEKGKPLPIEIDAEDITDNESYRFAAAEVIQSQFASRFEVAPKADLVLYLSGTDALGEYEPKTQDVSVRVQAYLALPLAAGGETRRVTGVFVFARDSWLMKNYRHDERVQQVKETVYRVLSDFLSRWEGAPK